MLTALDDRNARMLGLSAGAEDFLTKPMDRAELSVRVRNLLRLKAYGDKLRGTLDELEAANAMIREEMGAAKKGGGGGGAPPPRGRKKGAPRNTTAEEEEAGFLAAGGHPRSRVRCPHPQHGPPSPPSAVTSASTTPWSAPPIHRFICCDVARYPAFSRTVRGVVPRRGHAVVRLGRRPQSTHSSPHVPACAQASSQTHCRRECARGSERRTPDGGAREQRQDGVSAGDESRASHAAERDLRLHGDPGAGNSRSRESGTGQGPGPDQASGRLPPASDQRCSYDCQTRRGEAP